LLVVLVEDFEDKHYQLEQATPRDFLIELMAERNLKQKDLLAIAPQRCDIFKLFNDYLLQIYEEELFCDYFHEHFDDFEQEHSSFFLPAQHPH